MVKEKVREQLGRYAVAVRVVARAVVLEFGLERVHRGLFCL